MNKLAVIIALTLLLKPILPIIGYVANYDYIVNELCENKNEPILHCNGKCQLQKELAKASGSAEGNTADRKMKVGEQEVLFLANATPFLFLIACGNTTDVTDSYRNLYRYSNSNNIFHPPLL